MSANKSCRSQVIRYNIPIRTNGIATFVKGGQRKTTERDEMDRQAGGLKDVDIAK